MQQGSVDGMARLGWPGWDGQGKVAQLLQLRVILDGGRHGEGMPTDLRRKIPPHWLLISTTPALGLPLRNLLPSGRDAG